MGRRAAPGVAAVREQLGREVPRGQPGHHAADAQEVRRDTVIGVDALLWEICKDEWNHHTYTQSVVDSAKTELVKRLVRRGSPPALPRRKVEL
jgi:hypothetical protein